jgi:predicted RNase H-like nuclease
VDLSDATGVCRRLTSCEILAVVLTVTEAAFTLNSIDMVFIGVDLAWQSERNPSGASVLHLSRDRLELVDVSLPLRSLVEVQNYIERFTGTRTVVAIDAPLIVTNSTGMRDCERELGMRYGGRHASCHATNLTLYPNPASVRLGKWLAEQGFFHPGVVGDRTMLEVYPHAAFVALFDLPRIIKYKKGTVSDKCSGLRLVQQMMQLLPITGSRVTQLLGADPSMFRGRDRKSYEDSLDSVFCAYIAFHFWQSGNAQSEMFGDRDSGYIMNPRLGSFGVEVIRAPAVV